MQSSGHTSVAAQGTGTERKATGRAQTRVEGETDRQRELTPTSRITREDFIPLKQEAPVPSRTRRAADADAWGLRDAAGPRRGQLGEAIATARARGRRRARCCASPRRPGRVSDRHMRTRGDRWALPVPVQGLCTCTCTGRRDVARARHVMPCRAAPRRRAVCSCCVRGRERDRRRGRSGSCGRPPRPCAAASSRRFGDGHKAHQARRAGRRALGCQRIFALLQSSSSSTPIDQRFRAANTATACMWIQVAGYSFVSRHVRLQKADLPSD
jgi:hypothetical protein